MPFMQSDSALGVVIPLRSLRRGKSRLSPVCTPDQRLALIDRMARRVAAAAHDLPLWVVHEDDDVAAWAADLGALPIQVTEPGLDTAVDVAIRVLAANGVSHAIIAHADLPDAIDLRPVAKPRSVSIVTDRHGDGTNVLSIPTDVGFEFAYGPGSARRHESEAARLGLEFRVVDAPDLSWDVDHPEDLRPDLLPDKKRIV